MERSKKELREERKRKRARGIVTFGGQVGNFRKDFNPPTDAQRAKEQKHLKAFLRGDQIFTFGKTPEGYPAEFPVLRNR